MLTVTVAQDGSGDFASIAEAVLAVPYEEEALVQVGPGIYREKLVCEKRCITLRGAGADKTKLVWGDGGKLPHKDGRPTHTFRSYTAFFSGETLCVEDTRLRTSLSASKMRMMSMPFSMLLAQNSSTTSSA